MGVGSRRTCYRKRAEKERYCQGPIQIEITHHCDREQTTPKILGKRAILSKGTSQRKTF